MAQDQQTFRRGTNAAIFGLVVQFVLIAVMGIVSLNSGSPALWEGFFELLGGLPIWIVLALLFNQHRLERIEALEAEELSRADASTATIFNEHGVDLQIARRRLDVLYKWGLGGVSMLVGFYLLGIGSYWLFSFYKVFQFKDLTWLSSILRPDAPIPMLMVAVIAVGFVAFIVARYEAGMTKISEWQLLRGGAAYLMGNFVIAFMLVIGMVAVLLGNRMVLAVVAVAIPGVMVLLGIEILFALMLSAYRPRRPGEIPRPSFDSRLLGMLTSPKSLAKALGEAINYQFGFEVSRSWFYQLLAKAIAPLVLFSMFVLIGMSCFVIVEPHQKAIITRNGDISYIAGPGLNFKWPWPFGAAEIHDVGRLQSFSVGSSTDLAQNKAILWTNQHSEGAEKERYLITGPTPLEASNGDEQDQAATAPTPVSLLPVTGLEQAVGGTGNRAYTAEDFKTPGMSLVGLQLMVQYRIDDLEAYAKSAERPVELLKDLTWRSLSSYLVTQDIDHLIGPERINIGKILQQKLTDEVKRLNLGIEIVFVGMAGVHPPSDSGVADAFHQQIDALQESQTAIERARLEEIVVLARVAGSLEKANNITHAILDLEGVRADLEKLRHAGKTGENLVDKEKEQAVKAADVEELLTSAQGEAARKIYEARAYRWERAVLERAKSERFSAELMAYRQSPSLYRMRRYLEVLAEGMEKPRKVVLVTSSSIAPTMRIDLKDGAGMMTDIMNGQ